MKYLLLMLLTFALFAGSANAQIAVIANKGVDLAITSNTQAADVFTLETQKSKNGVALVVFDLKAGEAKEKLYATIGKTSTELKKIWMKAQLSGEGKAPESLADEDAMLAKVAATPGAVGYVSQAKANGDVKVLFVTK